MVALIDQEWIEDQKQIADLLAKLKQAREEIGLSQAQVGIAMHTTQGYVGHFERMEFDTKLSTFFRYARAVGVRITFGLESIES